MTDIILSGMAESATSGLLKMVSITLPTTTVPGSSAVAITFTYEAPNGYTALGITEFSTGSSYVIPIVVRCGRVDVRNTSTSSISVTPAVTVLFARTAAVG